MDEQLYLMAVGLSLEEKVEKAIEYFRTFEHEALKRDPVNGYYLCDSYGKDSCVILDLAKRSCAKFQAHHNLTTLDPPELIMFGRHNHPETVVHKPAISMLNLMPTISKGPPTRRLRWCCELYKESSGIGVVKVAGVRAEESARRRAQWRVWTPLKKTDSYMLNPILYWTEDDVWVYLRTNAIPFCTLYKEGLNRLGCIGCPLNNKSRLSDFKRWPEYKQAWEKAITKTWQNLHANPRNDGDPRFWARFRTPEDMWDWWMEENQPEAEDDCQMGLF